MRTKCVVEKFICPQIIATDQRPFVFASYWSCLIWLRREFTDGRVEKALLHVEIEPGFITDGASTFWPISKLVPQWRKGDDKYNAAPTTHDVLYIFEGIIESKHEPVKLSREEVDDILRGMWRCWGMSRFIAGCADKGVEICAGGKNHWGNDQYDVKDLVSLNWEVLDDNS